MVLKNNWKEFMESFTKMSIMMKISTITKAMLYSRGGTFKKLRENMFVTNLSGTTSAWRTKSATKLSVKEVIYRFTKEPTLVKSHTRANSAAICFQLLETETTTREDISRINLTFAILLIIADKSITENISSSITFLVSINVWTSINPTWTQSSRFIIRIMLKLMAKSARTQMIWYIYSKMYNN